MLMRVYYLYEKSPKKCVQLAEGADELRQCLEVDDMPTRGNRSLRACGTKFIAHKVAGTRASNSPIWSLLCSFDCTD